MKQHIRLGDASGCIHPVHHTSSPIEHLSPSPISRFRESQSVVIKAVRGSDKDLLQFYLIELILQLEALC